MLPHAIANVLAAQALRRLAPARLDGFFSQVSARVLRSLSRRLGYLHDSAEARAAVARWLAPGGLLGDLFERGERGLQIFRNLAPVDPDAAMAKVELEIAADGERFLASGAPHRWQLVLLLKALAYDPALFDRAAGLIARFVAAEPPGHNNNSSTGPFAELFHQYLSGTMARPEQRLALATELFAHPSPGLHRAGVLAFDALLENMHFSAASNFDFGARSRDFGWLPGTGAERGAWYANALGALLGFADRFDDVRGLIAGSVRGLWRFSACRDAIEAAARTLVSQGGWTEGWVALRAALRFEGDGMPAPVRERLEAVIDTLRPVDLRARARAFVLARSSGGYDIIDAEKDVLAAWKRASQTAVEIGKAMAPDRALVAEFLKEVLVHQGQDRTYEFGRGLAQGAEMLAQGWSDLVAAYRAADTRERSATTLGGFLYEAHRLEPGFAGPALETIAHDQDLGAQLPYLQARVALDEEGLERLAMGIGLGHLTAWNFMAIANGGIRGAPAVALTNLLERLAEIERGTGVAIAILNMRLCDDREDPASFDPLLIAAGRRLLRRVDFTDIKAVRDFALGGVVTACLSQSDATEDARAVFAALGEAFRAYHVSLYTAHHLLEAVFKSQPELALDMFLLGPEGTADDDPFEAGTYKASPIETLGETVLADWAGKDSAIRYPRLANALSLFKPSPNDEDQGLSPVFLALLGQAPDKAAFLGDGYRRIHPMSWSGSLADVLERRRTVLAGLADLDDPAVAAWLADQNVMFERWIAHERRRGAEQEESFE